MVLTSVDETLVVRNLIEAYLFWDVRLICLTPTLITSVKVIKKQTIKGFIPEVVNPDSAGIEISPKEMQVCIPEDRDSDCNRKFGVYTEDLNIIAKWLKICYMKAIISSNIDSLLLAKQHRNTFGNSWVILEGETLSKVYLKRQ